LVELSTEVVDAELQTGDFLNDPALEGTVPGAFMFGIIELFSMF
jgi:hypothetical protein